MAQFNCTSTVPGTQQHLVMVPFSLPPTLLISLSQAPAFCSPPPAAPSWLLIIAGHLLTRLLTPGELWVCLLSFFPWRSWCPWHPRHPDGASTSHVPWARASRLGPPPLPTHRLSHTLLNHEETLGPGPPPSWLPASDIFDPRWNNFSPKCECICELIENSPCSGDRIQGRPILAAILIVT